MTSHPGQRQFGYIRKMPSGRWQASYRGPDGQRRTADTTFRAKADAGAWLSGVQTDLVRGDWRPPEPAREAFGPFATAWLELGVGRRGEPLSPTTAELYALLWRKWLAPAFEDVAMGDLTLERVRTWLAKARKDHPGSTQPEKAYRLLRSILNEAVDDEKIRVNPCRVKGAGREAPDERPVVMPDDVLRIAENLEPRYSAMVILAAWCSLRIGEIAGLRRHRVDLLHRKITVAEQAVELAGGRVVFKEPKWDSRRVVDIPAEIVELLEQHLASHVSPCEACRGEGRVGTRRCSTCTGTGVPTEALLFTSPEGHPLRRTKFRARWSEACDKAGVPAGLHFHDLRGSGATWAAHQGATLAELMQRLGHRTHTAALRYQHATSDRSREIADRLGALLTAATVAESGDSAGGSVVPLSN